MQRIMSKHTEAATLTSIILQICIIGVGNDSLNVVGHAQINVLSCMIESLLCESAVDKDHDWP